VVGTTLGVGHWFCGRYGTGSHLRDAENLVKQAVRKQTTKSSQDVS
jgi:hypothetical protein